MTVEQATREYFRRTMFLTVHRRRSDKRAWREWDRLTPAERRDQHERFEAICANLDRDKCASVAGQ